VAGFLLAAGRSRRSSIAGIVLACACFTMVFFISRNHTARVESFKRITGSIEQYFSTQNTYPSDLFSIPGLTNDDQSLITYLPGAMRNETVTWEETARWMMKTRVESPRMVCFLKKITFGDRLVYLANGKIVTIATTKDFEGLLNASQKEKH
jgi:hypothetical protein